ncbi:MAG: GNAT family N-acetyltransferase [Actinomycetota bacterium]|nr:GNAT family N-acetyltransferase [Actinomycetota bacterium]
MTDSATRERDGRAGKGERLRESLVEMLRSLPEGSALPTERELCERFDVSRGTVRTVLQRLEAERRIYRHQGRGTFAGPAKIEQRLGLTSHTEEMRASGFKPGSKLIDVSRLEAPIDVASALALPAGAEALKIERLRLADGEPIALEVLYLDAERFDGITGELGEDVSFYQLLRLGYGVELESAEETIEAVIATPREARFLGCVLPAALLQLTRLTVDSRGRPVEFVRSLYRADRFRFRQHLQRPREPGSDAASLRVAAAADASGLAAVFVSAWRERYRSVVPHDVIDALDEHEIADWLRRLVTTTDQTTIVCEAHDRALVGFVRYGLDPADPRTGHIYALYVHGAQVRRGHGRRLLEHSLAALAERGHTEVTLWVFEENWPARELYASFGFKPDGATRIEPQYRTPEIRLRRGSQPAAEAQS